MGEHAHGRQRQHRGWPGQPDPSLLGARATPAQPASGGGCLPQPRWAVCATGGGAHQGQTSHKGERDSKGPPAHTPHQHQQPTQMAPKSHPPHPLSPQPDPVYPCTAMSHNRNSGCRGDLVTSQGGSAGRSDSQWASRPEELLERVSACRGWGTQRANPGPCSAKSMSACAQGTQHPVGHHWGPGAFGGATSARRGSGTQGANPGPLQHSAAVRLRPGDPAPRWPPLGPKAHYGKEWWARQGKEPPTEPGWEEPRTAALS